MSDVGSWNSFKRVEAVFDRNIPDRVPKYEGSIEIKDLNPMIDGQADPRALLFFSPREIKIFHDFPFLFNLLKGFTKVPRVLSPIVKHITKSYCRVYRQFNYDIFPYTSGIPMVFNPRIFRDFRVRDKGTVIKHISGRVVWGVSINGAHMRRGFLEDPADWDKYIQFDSGHPANYFMAPQVLKISRKLDIVPFFTIYGAGAFEELCGMFGFETLFRYLIKEKGFIRSIIKQLNDYACAVAEIVIEKYDLRFISFTGDLGLKGRTLISPRMFRQFFKPIFKSFCRKVHELGGKIFFHSCGNIMALLNDFVDVGIDALHPIEKEAGNDIVAIKERYGAKLIVVGNVPIPILTHGSPEDVRDYVLYLFKNVSKDGGHILSSS
ncbi:MAG: uroporphyrinogen decarboxylase family protein, partial [Promethearchaeota archaeon]